MQRAVVGNALKGAAESEIRFRGRVRKLSGAERWSKEVAAAIRALRGARAGMGLKSQRGVSISRTQPLAALQHLLEPL